MAYSKVILNNETLIDLTSDTITPSFLRQGITAHQANGEQIIGTYSPSGGNLQYLTPYFFDKTTGYVDSSGKWIYENSTNNYSDVYATEAKHFYVIGFGSIVGTRFRCMFTTTDITSATANVSGTLILAVTNPAAGQIVSFQAPSVGYIVVTKDNNYKTDIPSYCFDFDFLKNF